MREAPHMQLVHHEVVHWKIEGAIALPVECSICLGQDSGSLRPRWCQPQYLVLVILQILAHTHKLHHASSGQVSPEDKMMCRKLPIHPVLVDCVDSFLRCDCKPDNHSKSFCSMHLLAQI